jgi:signal transduction histidine kinase/DNA-binding NarL/FixJ family response regulator
MGRKRHISIQAKMLIAAFIYMCFVVTSLYLFLPPLLRSQQFKDFQDNLELYTESLASKLGESYTGTPSQILETVSEFMETVPELESADIVDWTGTRIASYPGDFPVFYERSKDGLVIQGDTLAVYGKPIISDNVVVAFTFVSQKTTALRQAVDTLRAEIIIVSVLVLIVSLLIAFHLSSKITQPIEELSRATKRLAAGDYAARADISTRDEVGLLAHHFNRMAGLIESGKEDLEKAIFVAESATKAKSEFLATMSHEIRSPLNGIIGMSRVLLKTPLTEDQKEYASTVASSGNVLLSVINDVLDFSKIESGQMELEIRPFDLRQCVDEAIQTQKYAASNKKLELRVTLDPRIPESVSGDETRIRQVVINLVSNAIKFTSEGGVSVDVRVENRDQRTSRFLISVADTGVGIDREGMGNLFKSFSQADESIHRQYGGTGLGLAISRQISEMMGGTLWAESEPGVGSTFFARIELGVPDGYSSDVEAVSHPVEKSTEDEIVDVTAPEIKSVRTVLLVEDNPVNQRVGVLLLTGLGYDVDAASCGQEAIEAAQKREYDAILMDLRMPDMSGIDATREIRRNWKWSKPLQVIPVTADVTIEKKRMCEDEGMFGFVSKPVTEEILESVLQAAWGERKSSPGVFVESVESGESEECSSTRSPKFATDRDPVAIVRRFLGENDPEMISEVLKEFIKDASAMVKEIRDGVAGTDFVTAGRAAHSLKSTAAMLGFDTLSFDCLEIERICDNDPSEDLTERLDHLDRHLKEMKFSVRSALNGASEA